MFRKLHNVDAQGLTIYIDGIATVAEPGESIAAVLLRQPEPWSRQTPASGCKRAPYCMMGVCFECLAEVDGVKSVQTCMKPVSAGMRIVRQLGKRKVR